MSKKPEVPSSSTPANVAATTSAVTNRTDPDQSNVKKLNSATDLEKSITQSGNKVVLVEFYAPWCGPCRMIEPKIEELAKVYFDQMLLVKVDVDDFEEVAMQYNVTSMPTFLIFKDKKQLEMVIGSASEQELENAINKHCNNTKQAKEPTAATSGAPAAKPPAPATSGAAAPAAAAKPPTPAPAPSPAAKPPAPAPAASSKPAVPK